MENENDKFKLKSKDYKYFEIFLKTYEITKNKAMYLSMIMQFISNLFPIIKPIIYGNIINNIVNKDYESVMFYMKLYCTFIFTNISFQFFQRKLYTAERGNYINTRLNLYKSILSKDVEFFDYIKPGEVLNRVNNDYYALYYFKPTTILRMGLSIFRLTIAVFYLMFISYQLFLIHCIIFAYDSYTGVKESGKSKQWDEYSRLSDEVNNFITETISNIRVVKSFSTEEKEVNKLKDKLIKSESLYETIIASYNDESRSIINNGVEVTELFFSILKIISGEMTLGDFTSFQMISKDISYIVPDLLETYKSTIDNSVKCNRIFELIDYVPKIDSEGGSTNIEVKGKIEFKNVSFSYPLRPTVILLNDFNLCINIGEVVAIVGHSGSGKSTIAALIQRLYDVSDGELLIDGENIKNININHYHNLVGYVSQEPVLFSDTIENNIKYAVNDVSEDDLINASVLSNAYEFISNKEKFPDGFKTMLGDKGLSLSGGQKQRIAISRALIKNVKMLIFDEATSALDANSEKEVQNAIDEIIKLKKITTIIIAHRLSTVKNCDRIIVMDNGRIVEEGKHKELITQNGPYKKLVESQLEYSVK